MGKSRSVGWLVGVLMFWVLQGCAEESQAPRAVKPERTSAPFNVRAVMEQVQGASRLQPQAALAPTVSPEFGMDAPVYVPAEQYQRNPVVAHDGNQFFVVWEDLRTGTGHKKLFGARVDATGKLLDEAGILLSSSDSLDDSMPAIAYNGSHFLVVWVKSLSNYTGIHARRVSSTGTLLDSSDIVLTFATEGVKPRRPAVAFNGSHFLVVWQDSRSGTSTDIYGARVDATGTVLEVSGIPVSTAPGHQEMPAVVSDGKDFLVVWQDFRAGSGYSDIYGTRVDGTGAVLDSAGIALSTAAGDQRFPEVAHDGSQFLVVWNTLPPEPPDSPGGTPVPADPNAWYGCFGTRVSSTGTVLDGTALAISTTGQVTGAPSVAQEGSLFLVVWEDKRGDGYTRQLYGARVAGTGTVLDDTGFVLSASTHTQTVPAVAHGGSQFLVVWDDVGYRTHGNILGARVDRTGTVLASGTVLSTSAQRQSSPSVAHDGENYLVVWVDYRSGTTSDIYGARVDATGRVLDSAGIAISTAAGNQVLPMVAHDGQQFLVVWSDYRNGTSPDIYGARVSRTGTVMDPEGLALSPLGDSSVTPAVASNGSHSLVVWSVEGGTTSYDIRGVRVDHSGAVLEPEGLAISTATGAQQRPAVAWGGSQYFVVWQDTRAGGYPDIYGARVDGAGTVLEPEGIALSTAPREQYAPSVAHDGTNFLVVWEHRLFVGLYLESDIYGVRVDGAGTVLEPEGLAISTAPSDQQFPEVVYEGKNFFVAWRDLRTGKSMFNDDLYGARVDGAGTVLDVDGLVLSAGPQPEVSPALASLGRQKSLLVYSGYDTSPDAQGTRALARFIEVPNRRPVAQGQALTVGQRPTPLTLSATDEDGEVLHYRIETPPGEGTLSGTPPEVVYAPPPDFHGTATFTFTASDERDTSAPATITLHLANDIPEVGLSASATESPEGGAVHFTAQGVDPGGDTLGYTWDFGDGSALVEGNPVTHVYADDGTHAVTVTVRDSAGASAQASLEVRVDNTPPVAEPPAALRTEAGQEVRVHLRASDAAGEKDPLTWTLTEGPGTLTPEGLYTWTPPKDARGDSVVRARVADDEGGSAEVLLHVTVTPRSALGCSSTGGAAPTGALLLLALAALARRRSGRVRVL